MGRRDALLPAEPTYHSTAIFSAQLLRHATPARSRAAEGALDAPRP